MAGLMPTEEGQSKIEMMEDKTETIANILKSAGLDVHCIRVENFETECVGFVFINMSDPTERVWLEVRSIEAGSVVANHPGLTHQETAEITGGGVHVSTSDEVNSIDDSKMHEDNGEYAVGHHNTD